MVRQVYSRPDEKFLNLGLSWALLFVAPAMSTSQLSHIYYISDDLGPEITPLGAGGLQFSASYYGTTEVIFDSYQFQFNGSSILVVGDRSGPEKSLNVAIDGKKSNATLPASSGYSTWYQSPLLSPGAHSIILGDIISDSEPLHVDYAAVLIDEETKLLGRTLMVDDDYPGIDYDTSWVTNSNTLTAFQGTSHQTSTAGSSFSFSFTGTNMTLYGVFHWDPLGSFDLITTVDNHSPVAQTFDSAVDSNPTSQSNFVLFTSGELIAGNHTVSVNLSRCDNQVLVIDYITYTPSFSSLSTMPNLTHLSPASTSSPVTATPSISPDSASKKPSIGALVGGIVGGIVLVAIICSLLFIWRRKSQKSKSSATIDPFPVDVYTLTPSVLSPTIPSEKMDLTTEPSEDFSELTEVAMLSTTAQLNMKLPRDSVPTTVVPEYREMENELDGTTPREELLINEIQTLRQKLNAVSRPPDYENTV
ncbi:hypothetical protein C8J56DRAFT_151538 [Mycena floridula]|nr:hypothetical protein C8J56DRAFT_151538 [Mycena floridula]